MVNAILQEPSKAKFFWYFTTLTSFKILWQRILNTWMLNLTIKQQKIEKTFFFRNREYTAREFHPVTQPEDKNNIFSTIKQYKEFHDLSKRQIHHTSNYSSHVSGFPWICILPSWTAIFPKTSEFGATANDRGPWQLRAGGKCSLQKKIWHSIPVLLSGKKKVASAIWLLQVGGGASITHIKMKYRQTQDIKSIW